MHWGLELSVLIMWGMWSEFLSASSWEQSSLFDFSKTATGTTGTKKKYTSYRFLKRVKLQKPDEVSLYEKSLKQTPDINI